MEKYGVDTEKADGEKTASVGCQRTDCPRELDKTKNPPKCSVCGYEYLQSKKGG